MVWTGGEHMVPRAMAKTEIPQNQIDKLSMQSNKQMKQDADVRFIISADAQFYYFRGFELGCKGQKLRGVLLSMKMYIDI
ncbi:hypothetical protein ACFX1T_046379 [Malus domestica]